MPKKLTPTNPGAKKMRASSLAKGGGSNKPMDGAGSRGTGKPKLKPNNMKEATWNASGLAKAKGSNRPMDGVRGPKSTG